MAKKTINELHLDEVPLAASLPTVLGLSAVEDGTANGGISEVQQLDTGTPCQVLTTQPDGSVAAQDIVTSPQISNVQVNNGTYLITLDDGNSFSVPITDVDNSVAGQVTITDADGDTVTIPLSDSGDFSSILSNGVYTLSHTNGDGTVQTETIDTNADSNPFDPAGTNIAATNVGDAIDELANEERTWEDGAGIHQTNNAH